MREAEAQSGIVDWMEFLKSAVSEIMIENYDDTLFAGTFWDSRWFKSGG